LSFKFLIIVKLIIEASIFTTFALCLLPIAYSLLPSFLKKNLTSAFYCLIFVISKQYQNKININLSENEK